DAFIINTGTFQQYGTTLDGFQPIEATDEGALAGPGRAANDQDFPFFHFLGNTFEHVEFAIPFVDVLKFDHGHAARPPCWGPARVKPGLKRTVRPGIRRTKTTRTIEKASSVRRRRGAAYSAKQCDIPSKSET